MLPTLHSDRLVLRPWQIEDATFVFDMYSRPEVVRYLGRNPAVLTDLDQARERIAAWTAYPGPVHGVWAIQPTDAAAPIGTALLKGLPLSDGGEPSGLTEVGWHLHPDAWRHGYATEAGYRLLQHAWEHSLDKVYAVTYPENAVSQAVCRRLGMQWLGSTTDYYDVRCELFRVDRPGLTVG